MEQVHFYVVTACATLVALSKAAPDFSIIKTRGNSSEERFSVKKPPHGKTSAERDVSQYPASTETCAAGVLLS